MEGQELYSGGIQSHCGNTKDWPLFIDLLPLRKRENVIRIGLEGGRTDWRAQKMFKEYDEDLGCRWIKEKQRWGIFTKDKKGKEYLVFIVQNKDGSYRNIDRRDLISIVRADLFRRAKADTILKEIEAHNQNLEDSRKKQLSNDVQAIARERWRHTFEHPVVNVPMTL